MSKGLKVAGIIVGVAVLLFGLRIVDTYVYPFQKANPNFSDVETAFAKLQFPSDWQEISSSENRGLYGRDCAPIDNSGCFHKGRTFKVPEQAVLTDLKKLIIESGLCNGTVDKDITQGGESKPSYNVTCSSGNGTTIGADFLGVKSEVYVSVKTY